MTDAKTPKRRISEHTGRLSRLHIMSQDRPVADSEMDAEFHRVCLTVWGYTMNDIDEGALSEADNEWHEELEADDAERFASEHGYDLFDHTYGRLLDDWWGFTWMILAEKRGLLTPDNVQLARLKNEADEFVEKKAGGVISGR